MKNYELLGHKELPPTDYVTWFVETLGDERQKRMGSPDILLRLRHIDILLNYASWMHIGHVEIVDVVPELEEGLVVIVDYFHGDWWTEVNIRRVAKETPELLGLGKFKTVEKMIMLNAQHMDRSIPSCKFKWYEPLRSGIIFGGLLEKWDEVAHICAALDVDVSPEYSAGTINDEYFQYYLCVAGKLSGQWSEGFEKLLESAKKCRQKRLRDLLAAWEAAVAGNQAAFDKAFPAAIKSFLKRKDDPSEYVGVALDETVIGLIAKRAGLSFPDMSDKLNAAVMTRKSLGLDTTP